MASPGLFVELWMHLATHRAVAYELLLRLCLEQLQAPASAAAVPWVLVEAAPWTPGVGRRGRARGSHDEVEEWVNGCDGE